MANPKIDQVLNELTREVSENETVIDSAIAFIHGVPGLVAAAVAEADLSPQQALVFTDLNNKLDKKEKDLIAALTANTPPVEPPVEPSEPV